MLNCIIVDDEQPAIHIIESYVRDTPYLNLVGTTTNPIEGLEMINLHPVDLVFLDIKMAGLTGIEFIKALNGRSKVIITSAHSEFAMDGFELEVIDYLLKPVSFVRFLKAAQKAYNIIGQTEQRGGSREGDFIMLQGDMKGKLIKVEIGEIDYVEGMGNYAAIYCKGKKILSIVNLKTLEEKLPRNQFVRVHKSFIVAISQIALIEGNLLVLKGNYKTEITIGNAYRTGFLDAMRKKLIN
jgi:two-component system, LytTR family, response regulator